MRSIVTAMARLIFVVPAVTLLLAMAGGIAARADDCMKPEWTTDSVRLPFAKDGRTIADYVELGDVIAVKVAAMADLRACAAKNKQTVLLYLNGMPLKGLAELPLSNPAGNEAWFTLGVNAATQPVWNTLLGSPGIAEIRAVGISLGLSDGYPLTSTLTISLRPLPPLWFAIWAGIFVVGVIVFFIFAAKSNLLRGGTPVGGNAFSIARSQAAWGFFIVIGAYLLIGLTTGNYTTSLNATALSLLGIAAATHLGSAVVDASKDTPAEADARRNSKTELRLAIVAAGDTPNPAHTTKLEKLNGKSQGWLIDVLSDSDGIDFHRFQMLAWSLVLGIVFMTDVGHGLAMPDFSTTLLGLMGLSAGTYVGLKIPESTT